MKMVDNIYYIVLARDSDGDQLKKQFREEFQIEDGSVNLTVLNRKEAIETFKILEVNINNEKGFILGILEKVPTNSLIFCDEASMIKHLIILDHTSMKIAPSQFVKDYDWENFTDIINTRRESNVQLILSFKPVVEQWSDGFLSVDVRWPEEAEVVKLNRSYRQSKTLFNTLQEYHSQGVRVLNAEARPVDVVLGPEPTVLYYYDTDEMKTLVLHKLEQLGCSADKVKILFTKNSSEVARTIFNNSRFSPGLTNWSSFIGCEAPVIVMFFTHDDKNWEFMQMASRAQYKVNRIRHVM